jgi:hypothetical protein
VQKESLAWRYACVVVGVQLSCGLTTLTFCRHAAAQGSPADKAAAETLFQQGKQLMDENRVADACRKFQASHDLDAGLGVMLYLADCYESWGRTASAWALFEEAASVAAARGEAAREQIARARADILKPRLSYINVRRAEHLPSAARVTQNGSDLPLEALDVPIPIDPGSVAINVSAPGYLATTVTVTVPAGATQPVEVTLPGLKPVPQAPPTEPSNAQGAPLRTESPSVADTAPAQPLHTQEVVGLIVGGVGVVALGASLVFTLLGIASNDASRDNDNCVGNECNPEGKADRDTAIQQMGVATALGLGGAAALGIGAGLYIAAPARPTSTAMIPAFGVRYSGVW